MTKKLYHDQALVIFSGGQDSTTCLIQAIKCYGISAVHAITFHYGQRHAIELDCAKEICQRLGIFYHYISYLEEFPNLTNNALMNTEILISQEAGAGYPNTFVPGRNALFLTYAAIYAYQRGIQNIIIGVSQADYSGYPDCRENFIHSINLSINLAMDKDFIIHTPLMHLDKAAIWALSDQLGYLNFVQRYSHTCYLGIPKGCGTCPSCLLRHQGLKKYIAQREKK